MQNLGCDIRVLQIDGAKDPDEFVLKFGPERFLKCVENAISLVEFKVKILKSELNIDNTNDKIKFLNEIAKILAKVTNQMEREIYIDKIVKEHDISKESIYAEVNKLIYTNKQETRKIETKIKPTMAVEEKSNEISEKVLKRESMVIYLLINEFENSYDILKQIVTVDDFKDETNKEILKKMYEEFEKGNITSNNILNCFEEEEKVSRITKILAIDFEITDVKKAVDDVVNIYQKEKMQDRKNEILRKLNSNLELNEEDRGNLEKELNDLIIKLIKKD